MLDLEGEGSRQPVLHEEYNNGIVYVISVACYVSSTGNRWIYIMQINVLISKLSDVVFWKPGYFGVGFT